MAVRLYRGRADPLKGAEIASLVIGHTLQGQIEPGRQPAILQIGSDGKAAFRTPTRLVTETVYVDGDLLCEQSENLFGRPDCGPVYRRKNADRPQATPMSIQARCFTSRVVE